MNNIVMYVSNSSKNASFGWNGLLEEIQAIDGIVKDAVGQKGLSGADAFVVEVVRAGLFTKLADAISGWLIKDRRRRIKLRIGDNEIEVFDIDESTQEQLIKWFQTQVGFSLAHKKNIFSESERRGNNG